VDYGTRDVPGDYDDRRGCCGCFAKGVRPIPAAYEPGRLGLLQDLGAAGRVKGTAPGPGCALAAAALLNSGADAQDPARLFCATLTRAGQLAVASLRRARARVLRRWGTGAGASQAREPASALGRVGSVGSSTNWRCSSAEAFTAAWRLTGLAHPRAAAVGHHRAAPARGGGAGGGVHHRRQAVDLAVLHQRR